MYGNLSLYEQGVIRLSQDRPGLTGRRSVPCLPHSDWDEAIRVAHIQGGHMGRDVKLSCLVARAFFPCMKGEVGGYIEACRTCQTKHGKGPDQRLTLRSVPAGYPFQRIHIDLVGPLNKGARTGASNTLTVHYAFTKWVEAIPLTATTTLRGRSSPGTGTQRTSTQIAGPSSPASSSSTWEKHSVSRLLTPLGTTPKATGRLRGCIAISGPS